MPRVEAEKRDKARGVSTSTRAVDCWTRTSVRGRTRTEGGQNCLPHSAVILTVARMCRVSCWLVMLFASNVTSSKAAMMIKVKAQQHSLTNLALPAPALIEAQCRFGTSPSQFY